MKRSNNYIINVLAVGFFTLVLLSVLLFWGRKLIQGWTYEALIVGKEDSSIKIQPSGLLSQLDAEPNLVSQSYVAASIGDGVILLSLGLMQDCFQELYGSRRHLEGDNGLYDRLGIGKSYYFHIVHGSYWRCIYFDKEIKKFVNCSISKQIVSGESKWQKQIHSYAGPDGVSIEANAKTGEFSGLFITGLRDNKKITIYDKNLRRFFQISFDEKTVTKGPELDKNYHPMQIDYSEEFSPGFYIKWKPTVKDTGLEPVSGTLGFCSYHIVLDESGYIYLLNPDTLGLGKQIGYLSQPPPFGDGMVATTDNLFAYSIVPVSRKNKYVGMAVGSISREGTGLAVSVFDPNGNRIKQQTTWVNPEEHPGGPLLMALRYILENLQAPILGVTSYLTASSFEAVTGHRALFILPESFAGWFGRDKGDAPAIVRFIAVFVIIAPSILLSFLLAWRVRKNSITVGLSTRAKRWWFWASWTT